MILSSLNSEVLSAHLRKVSSIAPDWAACAMVDRELRVALRIGESGQLLDRFPCPGFGEGDAIGDLGRNLSFDAPEVVRVDHVVDLEVMIPARSGRAGPLPAPGKTNSDEIRSRVMRSSAVQINVPAATDLAGAVMIAPTRWRYG